MVDSGIAIEDLVALIADPGVEPALDEGALRIAAVATGIDVDGWLARLDDLALAAERAGGSSPADLARVLFVEWGIAGNTADYDDPRNSFLPDVVERRLGLPISLSVLMVELGRRIGIGVHPVGMPAHFVVGVDGAAPTATFVDPFHAGAVLERGALRARFAELTGGGVPFADEFLDRTTNRAVLLRMLTNLQQSYARRRDPAVRWVVTARLAFPELPAAERERGAELLATVGDFRGAARVLDELAGSDPDARSRLARRAGAHRARTN
jgi:regulator of sirC expression with transglutaminase-like and TPR domain